MPGYRLSCEMHICIPQVSLLFVWDGTKLKPYKKHGSLHEAKGIMVKEHTSHSSPVLASGCFLFSLVVSFGFCVRYSSSQS
ncbi:hypothetical protein RJT34_14125 [Clitoria ternatea]|uniref:Uncharacterized protein n=1 Tax=Clitoria ternatea TaxID=43366 RepID=A0AAN9JSE0_CLITE